MERTQVRRFLLVSLLGILTEHQYYLSGLRCSSSTLYVVILLAVPIPPASTKKNYFLDSGYQRALDAELIIVLMTTLGFAF